MGECAGAALALSGMFSWLGAPDAAASLLARARRWFGPPKGRSGVTCALALAHARALFRARARRPGEEARALARETCAAAELFASGASGDHTGVFPRAWRVAHLRACGEATSASLCSPASLYARAATLRADIADADAATIGTDDPTNEEWVRVVERAGEWRARETEAWRRAALATASPRVARALAAAMAGDETSERAVVAAVDTRRERRDGEYADENVLDDADDDDEFGDAGTHDVIGLVRALRRRRFASARAGRRDDAAETADRLVAVVVAALGDDHPERGAAKLEAAELASAAAANRRAGREQTRTVPRPVLPWTTSPRTLPRRRGLAPRTISPRRFTARVPSPRLARRCASPRRFVSSRARRPRGPCSRRRWARRPRFWVLATPASAR